MSAKLVHEEVPRLLAVRAALQRSVVSRQGAATVHLRRAFVHERADAYTGRPTWRGDTR